jgi:hypothetical protein
MGLMRWLGWVSLEKYNALEDSRKQLAAKASAQFEDIAKLRAALAAAKENHADVAGMLDQAMESVTSAVGFVALMDAAKKKLERLDGVSHSLDGAEERAIYHEALCNLMRHEPVPGDLITILPA